MTCHAARHDREQDAGDFRTGPEIEAVVGAGAAEKDAAAARRARRGARQPGAAPQAEGRGRGRGGGAVVRRSKEAAITRCSSLEGRTSAPADEAKASA